MYYYHVMLIFSDSNLILYLFCNIHIHVGVPSNNPPFDVPTLATDRGVRETLDKDGR